MFALSIVSPNGARVATGRKTIEVRSWRTERLPLRNLLIVENRRRLTPEEPVDPDGTAIAIADVTDIHEWQPSEVEAACATTWQPGYWAWCLENIRPIKTRFQLPAKREIYEVDLHLRAAAVILNNDAVLLHRRDVDAFWALPGGRIEPGETAQDALRREVREELSESIECERLIWVVENTYVYDGRQNNEVGFYYLARPLLDSKLKRVKESFSGCEKDVRLVFSWVERAQLAKLDVRPAFVAQALAAADFRFQHVAIGE